MSTKTEAQLKRKKRKTPLGAQRISYSIRGLWRGDWVEFTRGLPSLESAILAAKARYPKSVVRIEKVTSVEVAEVKP